MPQDKYMQEGPRNALWIGSLVGKEDEALTGTKVLWKGVVGPPSIRGEGNKWGGVQGYPRPSADYSQNKFLN